MLERFLESLRLEDAEAPQEPEYSWKTFRVDDRIWNQSFLFRPGIKYYRQLQSCYIELLEELSGSYLYDIDSIREEFNNVHLENCRLEKELAIAQGTIEILERQLESAITWQTATGRKNEVLTATGREPEPEHEQAKENNKFVSADGRSKLEKMKIACTMKEFGISISDISKELGVSTASVRTYLSTIQKHYTVITSNDGRCVVFDKEYGNDSWNLEEVYGDEWVIFEDDTTLSHQGEIIKAIG